MYDNNTAIKNAGKTMEAIGGLKNYFNNFNTAKTGGQKLIALFQIGNLLKNE